MKNKILTGLCFLALSVAAFADVAPGSTAPDFTAQDMKGGTQKLSDLKGKWVVLEWFNKGCPFVKKHYESQNMQKLQAEFTKKGVVWLTVKSSAPGKQGYESPAETMKTAENFKAVPSFILDDSKGDIGRLYGAKTTPHMFIINPEQKVVYAGAIDSNDSPDPQTIAGATNYVSEALHSGMSGKAVKVAFSKPYGCGVKY